MTTYLAQTAADAAGNFLHLTVGAGAIAALAGGVALIARTIRQRVLHVRNQVKLEHPVPEVPVTVTRKYSPPTFAQHMDTVRRVDRLEHAVGEIRREAAENYKELMLAGEARANRLIDKMDDVARAFHSRVDELMTHAPTPKPKPPIRKC